MKEIKPALKGLDGGQMLFIAHTLKDARLYNKRIACGSYRMSPLIATPEGMILQIPDDEPEELYK